MELGGCMFSWPALSILSDCGQNLEIHFHLIQLIAIRVLLYVDKSQVHLRHLLARPDIPS